METSTRIDDYHSKGCMVEQKCKNSIVGNYLLFQKSRRPKDGFEDNTYKELGYSLYMT